MARELGLIWAQAADGVIGDGGDIPWQLPEDQRRFRRLTTGASVVMGRKTWDSLPTRFRPLPGRDNIVVTRQTGWRADGAITASSIAAALALADPAKPLWCMGGGTLYAEMIGFADRLEVTQIDLTVPGDTRAPAIGAEWAPVPAGDDAPRDESGWATADNGTRYRFLAYRRR